MNIYNTFLKIIKISIILAGVLFIAGQAHAQVPSWNGSRIFFEDFGGGTSDPAWLLPSGGALQLPTWSLSHPGIGNTLTYGNEVSGLVSTKYNLNALNLDDNGRYAVTKIKYNDATEYNSTNNETNINAGAGDHMDLIGDHTTPGDNNNGYFVIVAPQGLSQGTVIYQKSLTVNPGSILSFTAWMTNIRKWGGASTNLTLKVTDGINLIKDGNYSVPSEGNWNIYGFEFQVPDAVNSITVSIILNHTSPSNWEHTFAMDDIEIFEKEPIQITSPASPETNVIFGADVQLGADYSGGNLGNNLKYRWEKSSTADFQSFTVIGNETTNNTGTFTTAQTVTETATGEDTSKTVYYRLAVSNDNFGTNTIYSDILTVNYLSYLMREDFGGNTVSTSGSGDWWVMCSAQWGIPASGYNMKDNGGYPYADNNSGIIPEYGQPTIGIWGNRYGITKLSAPLRPGNIEVSDHTYENDPARGYFLLVIPNEEDNQYIYYKNIITAVDGAKTPNLQLSAWLVNLNRDSDFGTYLTFKVEGTNGYQTKTIDVFVPPGGLLSEWTQYKLPFVLPVGYTGDLTVSIYPTAGLNDFSGTMRSVFALDDIEVKPINPVEIITPESSEITILSGQGVKLKGSYVGRLTGSLSYWWETSADGENGWTMIGSSTNVNNEDFITDVYTTNPVTSTLYYRLTVGNGTTTLSSDPVKIIPVTIDSKTYWVCPDNMSYEEAASYRLKSGTNDTYLPGMVSKNPPEPGYMPSLIYMEVQELYGLKYKWYGQEAGGVALADGDNYDGNLLFSSQSDVTDPVLLSDGKTNTISVQNERNTEGIFKDRTYWVEICDNAGNPLSGINRIPVYLKQAYICSSINPVVSPATAKPLNRDNFGGTNSGDPNTSPNPLPGMSYIHQTVYDENNTSVQQGHYVVTKTLQGQGTGWYKGTQDHIYNLPNETTHGYFIATDGDANPGQFYTYTIDNLGACRDVELVFSGWLASPLNWPGNEKANLNFILTNTSNNTVLSEYTTGNLPDRDGIDTNGDENLDVARWRQYGFKFPVPSGVTSIKLTVINNSFGTEGGNDVLIDDIEIYLSIPPVTLTPSINSNVCSGEAHAVLEGIYADDGTLGKNLDFRWEFRKDASSQWTAISPVKTVTTGIVSREVSSFTIDPFDNDNTGDYRLVIGQTGAFDNGTPNYECMAVSNSRTLTYIDGTSDPIPSPSLTNNATALCYDDADTNGNITIVNAEQNADVTGYNEHFWILDGSSVETPDEIYDNGILKGIRLKLSDYAPGYHTITLTAFNSAGCSETSIHEFLIYPKTTTWTANGNVNNWNDNQNWDNGVPGSCTDVIIPNKSITVDNTALLDHYPFLLNPTVESLNGNDYSTNQSNLNKQLTGQNDDIFSLRPACDTITFKMGGAVARTDYLKYNFAYVDLDVKSNRWYSIAAPLRSMYSGDYFVEGSVQRRNPRTYMMKYNATNPQTGDSPIELTGDFSYTFNTLSEELYPGLGFAIWVDDENHTGVNEQLQPFRLPKDSIKYAMWTEDGEHISTIGIPERDFLGKFTYEKHVTGTLPNTGNVTEFTVNVKQDNAAYKTTLVGNPFMSHFDFSRFVATNSDKVAGGYYVWNGKTYDASSPGIFEDDPNEIAPMQSFIIGKVDGKTISDLKFTMDMSIKSPATNGTLRSMYSSENTILQMDVLRDGEVHSNIRLKYNPAENNEYNIRKDMWTLFSDQVKEPAVLYTLLEGKAASVRTVGNLSKPLELGIRTSKKGALTFRLSGLETLNSSFDVYLEDKLNNKNQDLRNNPEYTFDNQTGNIQGRFFLKIQDRNTSSIEEEFEESNSKIKVSTKDNQIRIESSVDDPIRSVTVHSVSGILVYQNSYINANLFDFELPFRQQVLIVSVTTQFNKESHKIIMK